MLGHHDGTSGNSESAGEVLGGKGPHGGGPKPPWRRALGAGTARWFLDAPGPGSDIYVYIYIYIYIYIIFTYMAT